MTDSPNLILFVQIMLIAQGFFFGTITLVPEGTKHSIIRLMKPLYISRTFSFTPPPPSYFQVQRTLMSYSCRSKDIMACFLIYKIFYMCRSPPTLFFYTPFPLSYFQVLRTFTSYRRWTVRNWPTR